MNTDKYVKMISDAAKDNKKLLIGAGATAGTLGAGYLLSGKDNQEKINARYKEMKTKRSEANKKNRLAKKVLRGSGLLAGTALAAKSGRPLPQAIGSGGLAGVAVGDMLGSTALPLKDLYKAHKKEFGTAPDGKSVAKVLAANALPSAALWGGVYGLKGGAIGRGMSEKLTGNINNAVSGAKESVDVYKKLQANPSLVNQLGTQGVQREINTPIQKAINGAVGATFATMGPDMIKNRITSIPGAYVTPESIIESKKKEIEQKSAK